MVLLLILIGQLFHTCYLCPNRFEAAVLALSLCWLLSRRLAFRRVRASQERMQRIQTHAHGKFFPQGGNRLLYQQPEPVCYSCIRSIKCPPPPMLEGNKGTLSC